MTIESVRRLPMALASLVFAYSACVTAAPPADCTARAGVTPLCGFERPEDIEPVANGARLLVSEYGSLAGTRNGRLVVFDPVSERRRVVYPTADAGAELAVSGWGDEHCPGPPGPGFSPHGIHHSELAGSERVLVVNHTGREAIEFFELLNADDPEHLALTWRGCVIAPDGIWMNDVAGLANGAFLASHMVTRASGEEALFAAEAQHSNTGWVMAWSPQSGWSKVVGSDGGLPNGIEVSADGGTVYINEYFGDHVTALDIASGQRLWRTAVTGPDNSSWSNDGLLLVASHQEDLHHVLACNEHLLSACPLRYEVVAIRPDDGAAVVLFAGGGDDPMGAATVAVEHQGHLYMGSFVGDRMVRIKRPATPDFPAAVSQRAP